MSDLKAEQNFNINKYSVESHIQYLETGISNVKQLLSGAKTNDDLDKAKVYFEALLQTAQSNLSKIIISEENMHTK